MPDSNSNRFRDFEGLRSAYEEACLRFGVSSSVLPLLHTPEGRRVSINSKPVGVKYASALAEALKLDAYVQELSLTNTFIGDPGIRLIAEALQNHPSLKTLILKGNNIHQEGGDALALLIQSNPCLNKLCVEWNYLGCSETGLLALMQVLSANRTITFLDLRNNYISDSGCLAIATALRQNPTLQLLDLRFNKIRDKGIQALLEVLHHYNTSLTEVQVSCNEASPEAQATISQALRENVDKRRRSREDYVKQRRADVGGKGPTVGGEAGFPLPTLWDATEKAGISELHTLLRNKQLEHEKAKNAELTSQLAGREAEASRLQPELVQAQAKVAEITTALEAQQKSAASALAQQALEHKAALLLKEHELSGKELILRTMMTCHEEELRKVQFTWEALTQAQEQQWQAQKDEIFTSQTALLAEVESLRAKLQETTANAKALADTTERAEQRIQDLRSSLASETQKLATSESEVDLKKQEISALTRKVVSLEEQALRDSKVKDTLQAAVEKARLDQDSACERLREELRSQRADFDARFVCLRREHEADLARASRLYDTLKEQKEQQVEKLHDRVREVESQLHAVEEEVCTQKVEVTKKAKVVAERTSELESERSKGEELRKEKQGLLNELNTLRSQFQKSTDELSRKHSEALQQKNVATAQLRDELTTLKQSSEAVRHRYEELELSTQRQQEILHRDLSDTVRALFRRQGTCACAQILV